MTVLKCDNGLNFKRYISLFTIAGLKALGHISHQRNYLLWVNCFEKEIRAQIDIIMQMSRNTRPNSELCYAHQSSYHFAKRFDVTNVILKMLTTNHSKKTFFSIFIAFPQGLLGSPIRQITNAPTCHNALIKDSLMLDGQMRWLRRVSSPHRHNYEPTVRH